MAAAETTINEEGAQPTAAPEPEFDKDKDFANLKSVATLHAVMVMGALTLWGAADAWAQTSGWGLAHFAAVANAIIAGFVIANTLHEWGHFAGARLAGAHSPVLEKPVNYFFMFNFPFDKTDAREFLWMSLGGIIVPWLLVLLALRFVPLETVGQTMLLAVLVTRAVQVSVFEVPIVMRAARGGEPREELGRQLQVGFTSGRYIGLAVGALVFLMV